MAEDFGIDVSHVDEAENYAYDTVVFQKEKPPLDTELNLVQQLQGVINRRQLVNMPSGWLSVYPPYTDSSLTNKFYTQNPTGAKPEYALVNGHVVYVTNTGDSRDNVNLVDLSDPPATGNVINGVFLEVWRALLDPDTSTNKPDPASVVDALYGLFMWDQNNGYIVGQNGLVLKTANAGTTWTVEPIDTKNNLNGVYFAAGGVGWVVGDGGVIGRTTSAGVRWTMLTSGTISNLNSIHAYSQTIAWAVGDGGTILKTTNSVTWVPMSSGTTSSLRKVHFYDNQVGWVVGENGIILKTTDGGATWLPKTSGVTVTLNSIHFWTLNYGFAVGDGGTILQTSDGGSSWVDQSANVYDGSYSRLTTNLNDIVMLPTIDERVTNEEVSSQMTGLNVSFVTEHNPITKGDGKGTTTNLPADVTVTVNGSPVLVDLVDGEHGIITLHAAPADTDTVLVSYWYKNACPVFMGRAWIVGDSGTLLRTLNIGAKWDKLTTTGTSYNLNAVDFVDANQGWIAGDNSVIKRTVDAGNTWTAQSSSAGARTVQRVFKEGNVETVLFLDDNAIHPDAAVETTKRVQIQYRIRVISGADPDNTPEAGISSAIMGLGPNAIGSYPYVNMGSTTGDYGLWQATCPNTVDGVSWAIPMFIVSRRNTTAYDPSTNPNGENKKNTDFIRPDLLTAVRVADTDILDVRRKIIIPSLEGLLETDFDLLSRNRMETVMAHQLSGGDRYGIELMQTDSIWQGTNIGGDQIVGASLGDATSGNITASLTTTNQLYALNASATTPTQQAMPTVTGQYSQHPWDYKAIYYSSTSTVDGKAIPGYWDGTGSASPTFVFSTATLNTTQDIGLTGKGYRLYAKWSLPGAKSLKYLPRTPYLTKNISGAGSEPFWYHGVLDSDTYRVIETWDSGIPGYSNYALAYSAKGVTDVDQMNRPSGIELHIFMTVGSTLPYVNVAQVIKPDASDVPYTIYSISKVNNITASFSHKISNIQFVGSDIKITAASGYSFVTGALLEIVAYAVAQAGASDVRNGATVNFTERTKAIGEFTDSVWVAGVSISGVSFVDIPVPSPATGAQILGVPTVETTTSLTQPYCWFGTSLSAASLVSISSITGWGTSTLRLNFSTLLSGSIWIQILVKRLMYTDVSVGDGLLISYSYVPHQTPVLSDTLTVEPLTAAPVVLSTLGTAGGPAGDPYSNPIEHLPSVLTTITDGYLGNYEPIRFRNYFVTGGYVKLPALISSGVGRDIILSSPSTDSLGRTYYSVSSVALSWSAEGLIQTTPRKIYAPMLARVKTCSDGRFMPGEYVLMVASKITAVESDNMVGTNDAVAVYRLPNKPISRM